MKLISMTDFVLETAKSKDLMETPLQKLNRHFLYANFLKQPLTLEMFIPCDDKGLILEEITSFDPDISSQYYSAQIYQNQLFQEAKQKVLFYTKITSDNNCIFFGSNVTFQRVEFNTLTKVFFFGLKNVEDCVNLNLDLAVYF